MSPTFQLISLRKSVEVGGAYPSPAAITAFNDLLEEIRRGRPDNRLLAKIPALDQATTTADALLWIGQFQSSLMIRR